MQVIDLGLGGPKLLKPTLYPDARGSFAETFNRAKFLSAGLPGDFVQDNQSISHHGVLRGLHLQVRQPQGKLVRVLDGHIFDVFVDLRRTSPTRGRWQAVRLAPLNAQGELELLWVPEGFAHGFLVLSPSATVAYKVTRPYDPGGEQTVLWNDPDLGIRWPLEQLDGQAPVLSPKDEAGVRYQDAELL